MPKRPTRPFFKRRSTIIALAVIVVVGASGLLLTRQAGSWPGRAYIPEADTLVSDVGKQFVLFAEPGGSGKLVVMNGFQHENGWSILCFKAPPREPGFLRTLFGGSNKEDGNIYITEWEVIEARGRRWLVLTE